MYTTIEEFKDFWLENKPFSMTPDVYSRVAGNTGAVLFRDGQFQVQLFLGDPNTEITDHIHPNVDSFEVYLGGDFKFRIHGNYLTQDEILAQQFIQRVKPNDWHGGSVGPNGGAFISIQYWLNDIKPTSVHHDWGGTPLDFKHSLILGK